MVVYGCRRNRGCSERELSDHPDHRDSIPSYLAGGEGSFDNMKTAWEGPKNTVVTEGYGIQNGWCRLTLELRFYWFFFSFSFLLLLLLLLNWVNRMPSGKQETE